LTIRPFQIMSPNHSIFACNENYNIVTFLCQRYHANTLKNQLYLATSPWWNYQLLIKIHPSGHFWFVLTKMHLIILFNVVATICHVTLVWALMAQANEGTNGWIKTSNWICFHKSISFVFFFTPKHEQNDLAQNCTMTSIVVHLLMHSPHIFNGFHHLLYFLVTLDQNE
jgi:hypothetical protein